MRYVILFLVVVSLLLVGCSGKDVAPVDKELPPNPEPPVDVVEDSADPLPIEEVDETIVEDDLDDVMGDINLDDW